MNNHFKSYYLQSKFYLTIAIIFGLIAIVQPVLIIFLMRESKEDKVIVMDEAGNYHLTRSRKFQEVKELQLECVKFATYCLFERTAAGIKNTTGLDQVFLMKNCKEEIDKLIDDEKQEFTTKQIVQTVEIGNINILRQKDGFYLANVTGQLIRTCQYMNHTYTDVKLFSVGYLMARNPDISANGQFPLAVAKITHYKTKDK